jgi:hypothetical protein
MKIDQFLCLMLSDPDSIRQEFNNSMGSGPVENREVQDFGDMPQPVPGRIIGSNAE